MEDSGLSQGYLVLKNRYMMERSHCLSEEILRKVRLKVKLTQGFPVESSG